MKKLVSKLVFKCTHIAAQTTTRRKSYLPYLFIQNPRKDARQCAGSEGKQSYSLFQTKLSARML